MFSPDSFALNLSLAIVTTILWGTWSVTFPLSGFTFSRFYGAFTIGAFAAIFLLCSTLGLEAFPSALSVPCEKLDIATCNSTSGCRWVEGPSSPLSLPFPALSPSSPLPTFFVSSNGSIDCVSDGTYFSLTHSTVLHVFFAFAGGVVWKIANVLLVVGIDLAGLAVTFPLAIGTALLLGTLVTYFIQPIGSLLFILVGLGLALFAVSLIALAYWRRGKEIQEGEALEAAVLRTGKGDDESLLFGDDEQSTAEAGLNRKKEKAFERKGATEDETAGLLSPSPDSRAPVDLFSSSRDSRPGAKADRDSREISAVSLAQLPSTSEGTKVVQEERKREARAKERKRFLQGIFVCILCGCLMGMWPPFVAAAEAPPNGLNSYASLLVYTFGGALSCPLFLLLLRKIVGEGERGAKAAEKEDAAASDGRRTSQREHEKFLLSEQERVSPTIEIWQGPATGGETEREVSMITAELVSAKAKTRARKARIRGYLWSLLGGALWAIGTVFNFVSGKKLGLAISFAIGQSNPLIGAAWGVLFFKEFEGTSKKTKGLLLGMSLFYVGAIASLGVGGSLDSS